MERPRRQKSTPLLLPAPPSETPLLPLLALLAPPLLDALVPPVDEVTPLDDEKSPEDDVDDASPLELEELDVRPDDELPPDEELSPSPYSMSSFPMIALQPSTAATSTIPKTGPTRRRSMGPTL